VRNPANNFPLPQRGQAHDNPARIDPESVSIDFSVMSMI
jgi:hypothetical protein